MTFLAQCRNQVNAIMYSLTLIETKPHHRFWELRFSPLWSVLLISCFFISFILSLVFLPFHASVNTLLNFFKHTVWNTLVRLIISLRENQPATDGMLQKEIINSFRKPAWQNTKLLLKMIISDLTDTWSNTSLTEFG